MYELSPRERKAKSDSILSGSIMPRSKYGMSPVLHTNMFPRAKALKCAYSLFCAFRSESVGVLPSPVSKKPYLGIGTFAHYRFEIQGKRACAFAVGPGKT